MDAAAKPCVIYRSYMFRSSKPISYVGDVGAVGFISIKNWNFFADVVVAERHRPTDESVRFHVLIEEN